MLRISLFLSACFHIVLLGIMSIILSQGTTHKSYTEKKFRVNLRENVAKKAISSSRRPDETRFKHSERLLLPSQEFSPPQATLHKTRQVKMVEPQPPVPAPSRALKKSPLKVQPFHDMTLAIQEFVVAAREFPTPIPKTKPTPIPTRIPRPSKQLQPVKTPIVPTPRATIPPVSSPTVIAKSTSSPEPDFTLTPQHTSTGAPTGTTTGSESQDVERLPTQEEETLLKQYLEEVAAKINVVKRYPRSARRKGWEGTVVIKLRILPTGEVEKIGLVEKLQYSVLNKAALQAIEKAQPFPRFYEGLTLQSITINVPIQFTLSK